MSPVTIKHPAHAELVERAARWLKSFGCGVVFDDRFQARTSSGGKPDALGFKAGVSILIECKSTRADFLADKKKKVRQQPELGVGDWRFYLCPTGVIKPEELPEGWGLLYYEGRSVKKITGIPNNALLERGKPFSGNAEDEQRILYSALRRVVLRGHFDCVYEPAN